MSPLANDALTELMRAATRAQQSGALADAEAAYRHVLSADPDHAGALYGLGTLALSANEHTIADELIRRAIQLRGEWAEALYHLALAQQGAQRLDAAITSLRRALSLKPAFYEAHYTLAVCLQLSGEGDKAIAAYRNALAIRGNDAVALYNFAAALRGGGFLDECILTLRRAAQLNPDFPDAFHSLGRALQEADRNDEAISPLARACELDPQNAPAHADLGAALRDAGRVDAALEALTRAVALAPNDPAAHVALGELQLLRGSHRQGLRHLEWRWKRTPGPWLRRSFAQPQWDGSDLTGRTILLHAEESLGATIHALRFIPLVARRGGRILVECHPALRRLAASTPGIAQWLSPGDKLPEFDTYCPLLSLPRVLGASPHAAPESLPYLRPPDDHIEHWRNRFVSTDQSLKVGLVWAGSPSAIRDRRRSLALSQLASLRTVEGVRLFSLQRGWAAAQVAAADVSIPLINLAPDLEDLADTAAALTHLDLVITVDTAAAHLAGALGRPVWTLLPFAAHWRWKLDGATTDLYPTMRLFRQPAPGEWTAVIQRVSAELAALASNRPTP
jgi:tetratricopeptide (TPR) repeat protein